jgi:hypothetical protein
MKNVAAAELTWARVAALSGIGSILSYFGAAFVPGIPETIGRLLAFAFGSLLAVSLLALYRFMAFHREGPVLQIACFSGIAAGVLVTTMLIIQVGNNMWLQEGLAAAETESAKEAARLVWRSVNRVQALVDVSWDIFICLAGALFGVAMLAHPQFGKILGGIGIVASGLLLVLNLHTFPTGPAYAGSIDLGPLVALWFLVVYVRILWLTVKG